ncbi:MAG: PAS domain-containing protein [Polyangiaceae bacterium]|nr:PAS domain-containing protein [Polyangiaceae bacterium]
MDRALTMFKAMWEHALDGKLVIDADGVVVEANPTAERLFGPRETIIGRSFKELEPAVRDLFVDIWQRMEHDNQTNGRVSLSRTRDRRVLDYRLVPNFVEDLTLAIFIDSTDAWETEELFTYLAEASEVLGASLDYQTTLASIARLAVPRLADWASVDMVAADGSIQKLATEHIDPSKVQYSWELTRRYPIDPNGPAGAPAVIRTRKSEMVPEIPDEMLVAVSQDEEALQIIRTLGLKSLICVPMVARDRVLGAISLVFAESGRRYDKRYLVMAEELGRRAAQAVDNAMLYRDAQDAAAQVRALNEDLENRVEVRTAQLQEANRELESFSHAVSHDLRAPIRHIGGFADMLMRKAGPELNEAGQRYVRIIQDAAKLAGKLIDDLLAFSKMSRTELRASKVSVERLVADAQHELSPDIEGRTIEWQVAPLPEVSGDPAMLRLVVRNLLSNALKYTRQREDARIEIGCTEEGSDYHFYVRDNGVGFDMRYAHKLFGVFQRLHSAEEFEGNGIGLALVQRVVYRHGGRCWAEGELDRGATFHFTLPVA